MTETTRREPSLRLSSLVTGAAACFAFIYVGWRAASLLPTFEKLDVPLPAVTILLLQVPFMVWIGIGVVAAALSIAKDFWVAERLTPGLNVGILSVVFVFVIAADAVLKIPIDQLLKGLGGR